MLYEQIPDPRPWHPLENADDGFRARFVTVPAIVDDWISGYRSLEGADILDFGCGEGVSALALALNYRPRSVVGVDIMPDPERCQPVARANLGIEALPANLRLHRVTPGFLHDPQERFDVAYSWSVFEHVDERLFDGVLRLIRAALRPAGLFLAQIAPLFYSSEGSHLTHRIREPWCHLLTQHSVFYERLCAAVPDPAERDALWSTYRTLNRITARELVERIARSGFEVLRTYFSKDAAAPPQRLRAIYRDEVLSTNQVVVLARPR